MTDITSTFLEFTRPSKRKLPSEAALTDLVEGAQAAERAVSLTSGGELDVDARPTVDPKRPMVQGLPRKKSGGMGMKMLAGGIQGLSQMPQTEPMPMQPIMMGDPIQLDEMAISRATGLRGYYQGGRIRRGQAGVVGNEIVEVDEEGATVIPAERMVGRTPEGELDVEARYEELEDAGQTITPEDGAGFHAGQMGDAVSRPDTRALLSRPSGYEQEFGEQLGVQQTADPLAQKEAELAEAMVVKPSGWKDLGYSLIAGLNNFFNKTNDNRTYSEIKRDRRVAQIAPQVELLRRKKADAAAAEEARVKQDLTKAQAEYTRGRLPAEAAEQAAKSKEKAQTTLARMDVIDPDDPNTQKIATTAGHSVDELKAMRRDTRDPKTMKVGNDVWQYDRGSGTWKMTDVREATEQVTLSVPVWNARTNQWDKQTRVVELPKSKAAETMAGLQRAGMQIDASAALQEDRQQFTAVQNDIDRKERLRRWAEDNKITRAKFAADLAERVATGKMTQEQADAALADFPQ